MTCIHSSTENFDISSSYKYFLFSIFSNICSDLKIRATKSRTRSLVTTTSPLRRQILLTFGIRKTFTIGAVTT
ncbi:hypothetical protein X975_02571, partial [Stegodyphus mimosarum]